MDENGVDDLFQKVGNDYRKRIIDPVTQESLKAVTARYTAEELIRLREKVKSEVQNDITNRLRPYNIVVEPSGVSITNFAFSEEFNKAIEQKQVAQQTAEKQRYVLQQAKRDEEMKILAVAMDRLPEDKREILLLSKFHEKKYKEPVHIVYYPLL